MNRLTALLLVLLVGGCSGEFRFDEHTIGTTAAGTTGSNGQLPPGSCTEEAQCAWGRLHCDVLSNRCVACVSDANCSSPWPRCDAALHRCVECGTAADCPGTDQDCEDTTRRCVGKCASSSCAAGFACDPSRNICVACFDNRACTMAGQGVCEGDIGRCVACSIDAQCPPEKQRCDRTTGTCRVCLDGSDCPANLPWCDAAGGSCWIGGATTG